MSTISNSVLVHYKVNRKCLFNWISLLFAVLQDCSTKQKYILHFGSEELYNKTRSIYRTFWTIRPCCRTMAAIFRLHFLLQYKLLLPEILSFMKLFSYVPLSALLRNTRPFQFKVTAGFKSL